MKLYIPTCALNFNNILSTESISPIGFYTNRGFGIKRFYPVCANDKEQAILLYSKYPLFNVEDTIFENSSIVIEINTNDYKPALFNVVGEYEGVEVYSCYQTIYLNPFNCRFYFNSNNDIWGTLSKAEPSLENKFYKFYNPNCRSADLIPNEEKFLWDPMFANVELNNIAIETASDVTVDRIKGFLYCFLIGMNNSVSVEIAKLKSLSRELQNTLSAVVNSPDHRPTMVQGNTINADIEEFNRIYTLIDENPIYNAELDKNIIESINNCVPLFKSLYEKYYQTTNDIDKYCESTLNEIYLILHQKFLRPKKIYKIMDEYSLFNSADPDSFEWFTKKMNDAVKEQEEKFIASSEKHQIDKLVQINDNSSIHIIDEKYKYDFYETFVNSQIKDEYKRTVEEKGVQEATAQAYTGGTLLKKMMGDKWENSSASNYMSELLNHFQNSSQFNLFATDNAVLQSFAAFCQKGDNIDRLSEYLVQCGFSEYGLAYGIYGATRGFATLPKTFTASLIDGDKDYYKEFSKAVWEMLFGVKLQNAELPQPDMANIFDDQRTVASEGETEPDTSALKPLESPIYNEASDLKGKTEFTELVKNSFDSPVFKFTGNKEKLREGLDAALIEFVDNDNALDFFSILKSKSGWGRQTIAKLKELVESGESGSIRTAKTTKSSAISEDQGSLFPTEDASEKNPALPKEEVVLSDNPYISSETEFKHPIDAQNDLYFFNDPDTIEDLKGYIGNEIEKVKWFFDDMKLSGKDRKYFKIDEKDNKWVIDTFLKTKKIAPHLKGKVNQIRDHFYRKYGI